MRIDVCRRMVLATLVVFGLAGCTQLIADYNLEAYRRATDLKAETGALIDKSSDAYSAHAKDVDALTTKVDAAYEFAAGVANNTIAAKQWQLMLDPNAGLYGEFVALWKEQGSISPYYRNEAKAVISEAFDYIICLEANKQKATKCSTIEAEAKAAANPSPAVASAH